MQAAERLGVDVVVGSERRQAMARSMGDRAVVVPLDAVDVAVQVIVDLDRRSSLDAVLAVDDLGAVIAAAASQRLGLRHNPPDAVAATRDKATMRHRFAATSLPQPDYRVVPHGTDVAPAAAEIGYPCVVKPVSRSASQGVIRVDDDDQARSAGERIRALLGRCPEPLLVESFVPGEEVAVEGLLSDGQLAVLAVFDKPDPMNGPFFEETIYVTPSHQPPAVLDAVASTVSDAAAALGLREGPVHAEVRIDPTGMIILLELAARTIGGLCARALRFGAGISLEEVVLRHALDLGTADLVREPEASGVMMLPIRAAGVLDEVSGKAQALAVPGVVGLEISIPPGRRVVPLPEGDRYLGFIFARGPTPASVVDALRKSEALLVVRLR
jgi:biotin carboxylase